MLYVCRMLRRLPLAICLPLWFAFALLAQAAMTVSNRGAVAASREAALEAAEQWVGIGARLIRSRSGQVVGKISADGQRIYRTTSMSKAQPYINLENKATGGNLHVRW